MIVLVGGLRGLRLAGREVVDSSKWKPGEEGWTRAGQTSHGRGSQLRHAQAAPHAW